MKIKQRFNIEENKVHIYTDKTKQTEVQEGKMKTGMVATFEGIDGEFEISVKGDTDGDGEVTIRDITMINNYRLYHETTHFEFEGVYKLSADVNNDNKVDKWDMIMMNNYRLYKSPL